MIWADPVLHMRMDHPYSVTVFDGVLTADAYRELLAEFPTQLAQPFDYPGGLKLNLNRTHPQLAEFLDSSPIWKEFFETAPKRFPVSSNDFKFEFSFLPTGGGLQPHTDTARKKQTAVFYFPPTNWDPSWGGRLEVVRKKDNPYDDYHQADRQSWDDVIPVAAPDYTANRVVLMKRCGHSFHGVRPVRCPSGVYRQSVTIAWIT